MNDDVRAAEAQSLVEHVDSQLNGGGVVCAYVPVGAEPGSVEMLDALLRHADRVLLKKYSAWALCETVSTK